MRFLGCVDIDYFKTLEHILYFNVVHRPRPIFELLTISPTKKYLGKISNCFKFKIFFIHCGTRHQTLEACLAMALRSIYILKKTKKENSSWRRQRGMVQENFQKTTFENFRANRHSLRRLILLDIYILFNIVYIICKSQRVSHHT